jgi:CheY-like chemotaxis protein
MKTVLTVDDSRVARTAITHVLTSFGYRVLEARNGREGLAVARLSRPALVLLDVLMPVMDGRQMLAALRHDPALRGVPVVMLTAVTGESLVEACAGLGISGYLVKPVPSETLIEMVGRVLGPPLHLVADAGTSPGPRVAL